MTIAELYVAMGLQVDAKSWAKGNAMIRGIANAARRYIAGEAVNSLGRLVHSTTEAATHLVSMSQAMGLTVEKTQEWAFVAQQSGSTLRELTMGMNQFVRYLRLYARGEGGKQLAERMREIGITASEAKEALASPEGLDKSLLKIADRLKGMGNTAERAALATQLFGARAGRAMVADMARGSKGIEELRQHFRSLGGEISASQALSLRGLGNSLKNIKTAFSGLASSAIATLAPALSSAAESAARWIAANRDLISGALLAALKAVKVIFEGIGAVVSWLGSIIRRALGGDDGAKAILIGIATAIATLLLPALYAMVAPVVTMMAPLIAIAAVVAAIAYAVLTWGPAIRHGIGVAINWLATKLHEVKEFIVNLPEYVGDAFQDAIHWIAREWDELMTYMKQKADDTLNKIPLVGDLRAIYRIKTEDPQGDDVNLTRYGGAFNAVRTATAPYANVAPVHNTNTANATHNDVRVTNNIRIDGSKSPADTATAIVDHTDNELRHALRGTGGNVQ